MCNARRRISAEELKALDVETSKDIDLEEFVPRGELDPVYFNSPYYIHPDGPIAAEALRVIGATPCLRLFSANWMAQILSCSIISGAAGGFLHIATSPCQLPRTVCRFL